MLLVILIGGFSDGNLLSFVKSDVMVRDPATLDGLLLRFVCPREELFADIGFLIGF